MLSLTLIVKRKRSMHMLMKGVSSGFRGGLDTIQAIWNLETLLTGNNCYVFSNEGKEIWGEINEANEAVKCVRCQMNSFGVKVGYKMGITEFNGKKIRFLASGAMQNISDNDFTFNQLITKGNPALHLKILTYLYGFAIKQHVNNLYIQKDACKLHSY